MAEAKNELENRQSQDDALDDRGTDAQGGAEILRRLRDQGFDGDDQKFSVAMGRPAEEIAGIMRGTEPPDDDIIMKARGIAKERGIEVE